MKIHRMLEIDVSCSKEQVTAAYRQEIFEYHPDRCENGMEYTKELNEAYDEYLKSLDQPPVYFKLLAEILAEDICSPAAIKRRAETELKTFKHHLQQHTFDIQRLKSRKQRLIDKNPTISLELFINLDNRVEVIQSKADVVQTHIRLLEQMLEYLNTLEFGEDDDYRKEYVHPGWGPDRKPVDLAEFLRHFGVST